MPLPDDTRPLIRNPGWLQGYPLLHKGMLTFAKMEERGVRIDVPYCERMEKKLNCLQKRELNKLKSSSIGAAWSQFYKGKTNWGSNAQLAKVLFSVLCYKSNQQTAKGAFATSEEALEQIDDPAVQAFLNMKRYEKANSTYIQNFLRWHVDGIIHPFFNLHSVQTYRSSSDSPNFQNIPARNPEISTIIRKAIIPRPGCRLVDLDYSQAEIRAGTCYHQDPRMIEYMKDSTKDMHRDMAAQIYCLEPGEVTKSLRHYAKNAFVFPQFYGAWYLSCAPDLWDAVDETLASNETVRSRLAQHGIQRLGWCIEGKPPLLDTFEKHVQLVERDFWGNRFKVYANWKTEWYNRYLQTGVVKLLTGFRCTAHMTKNQSINYAIQGTAFHWLLWSLIRLEKEMEKHKMKSMIIGQIHDSIVADVVDAELQDFLSLAQDVMTQKILLCWKWICVPLSIEAKASAVDGNWAEQKILVINT